MALKIRGEKMMGSTSPSWPEAQLIGRTGRLGNAILVFGVKLRRRSMIMMLFAEILLSLIVVGRELSFKVSTLIFLLI